MLPRWSFKTIDQFLIGRIVLREPWGKQRSYREHNHNEESHRRQFVLPKLMARSAARPRRIAPMTPKGTETIMEKIMDAIASFTVAGYRAMIADATVS